MSWSPDLLVSARALLLLAFAAAWAPASPGAEVWSLDRALETALRNSPDARMAGERIEGTRALVTQALASASPSVSVRGGYVQTNSPMAAFGAILNQRAFSSGLDFNHPGRIDNLNGTAVVGYRLYDGGRTSGGIAAAKAGARAAGEDLRAAQNQLAFEVIKSWLEIRKARATVAALEAGARAYSAAVDAARARFDAGQLLRADLLGLEVQLAQTREALASARHGAALAEQAFRFVLGLDASGEPVALAADDPALSRLAPPESLDFSGRHELASLREHVHVAEAAVRAARGSRRPSVGAFASYQYDQGWQLDRHADGWQAGVSVDVNVFDGGATAGRIRKAESDLRLSKEMLRKATLAAGLEVAQARLAHEEAVERLSVSAGAVEQAAEAAALNRARFEKGALLVLDLIGAEGRLIEARTRRALAEADEHTTLAELRRTLGLFPLSQP